MNKHQLKLKPLIFACSLALTACGGGGGSSTTATPSTPSATLLSGIAAAGAPIVGRVTVKGAMGNTKSALIEADGSYDVDVNGLTAPYRIRAVGTVGGRTYKLHSYAEESDLNGNVNVTPFTDLIIANAASQVAESFFDSDVNVSLDAAELEAQETALQAKLKNVFDALGVSSAIDLLNSTFSADHSGLDAALDLVRVEVDSTTNIATITNLIDNNKITDDVTDDADNNDALAVNDDAALADAVSDNVAIGNLFETLSNSFASGLPSAASLEGFLSADFLDYDQGSSEFLTDITTDPSLIGLEFNSIAISDLTDTTATVTFHIGIGDLTDPEAEVWQLVKHATAGWQIRGDQVPADYWFNFHCNDSDGAGNGAGACGVNTMIEDGDFSNNNTGNAAFASATATIIGSDGAEKAVIHMGTPSNANGGTAGHVQVYNAGHGYQYDWKAFGNQAGDIPASTFVAGDTVRFDLYTEDLDISNPNAPAIALNATPAFTFSRTIPYAPSTTPLYPSATAATLTAMSSYAIGDDLDIGWTKQAGTLNDEVLIQISDSNYNTVENWAETITSTDNTLNVAGSELSTAGLNQADATYELLVRIYTRDELTGQYHSRDYVSTIDGPAATPTPTPTPGAGLACSTESGWDDTVDGGLGAPINPHSFAQFEEVVVNCGSAISFTKAEVAGQSFTDQGETVTFMDTGKAATEAAPETGTYVDSTDTITFQWYIEPATCSGCTHSYVVKYSDNSIDSNLPAGLSFRETTAVTGASGSTYNFVHYSEQSNYGDMVRANGSDGEIWNETTTGQALP